MTMPTKWMSHIEITEDQQVRISKVLYLGQNRTKLDLIRISTNLGAEQPLSEGKLLKAESELYDWGIFDWTSVGPRRQITNQSQEEALIKVHEAKRNTITYGFGMEIARRGGNPERNDCCPRIANREYARNECFSQRTDVR